jgi:hypothetical protein
VSRRRVTAHVASARASACGRCGAAGGGPWEAAGAVGQPSGRGAGACCSGRWRPLSSSSSAKSPTDAAWMQELWAATATVARCTRAASYGGELSLVAPSRLVNAMYPTVNREHVLRLASWRGVASGGQREDCACTRVQVHVDLKSGKIRPVQVLSQGTRVPGNTRPLSFCRGDAAGHALRRYLISPRRQRGIACGTPTRRVLLLFKGHTNTHTPLTCKLT